MSEAELTPPAPPLANRALLILGHPGKSSLNSALLESYRQGLEEAGVEVRVLRVGEMHFDPELRMPNAEEEPAQALEPDLLEFRRELEQASHVAFFVPTWWVGLPAKLKALIDRSFLPGWAYRYDGKALPTGLLKGRSARLVITMDSPHFWYQLAHRRSLHHSFVTGTLNFVGFRKVRTSTLYRVRDLTPRQMEKAFARIHREGQEDATRLKRPIVRERRALA